VKLTIHLHLVPMSRMRRAIPPLPQKVFMAGTTLQFYLPLEISVMTQLNTLCHLPCLRLQQHYIGLYRFPCVLLPCYIKTFIPLNSPCVLFACYRQICNWYFEFQISFYQSSSLLYASTIQFVIIVLRVTYFVPPPLILHFICITSTGLDYLSRLSRMTSQLLSLCLRL
jgi:hypothetical protein